MFTLHNRQNTDIGRIISTNYENEISSVLITVSPVILHKGGLCAIHQSEGVFGRFIPLDGINSVGAVVVASDDNAAKEFFGAFILEVFLALLVQCVPGKQRSG